MKRIIGILIFNFIAVVLIGQTLFISNNTTLYVNRELSNTTTPMLYVNGNIQNDGTLHSFGKIATTGDIALNNTLHVDIGGTTLGSGYDQLTSSDLVNLDGCTLEVSLLNGFMPVIGDVFVIVDANSLQNTFATVNLPTLNGGLLWAVLYDNITATITLTVTTALPVALTHFKGQLKDNDVLLNWLTSSERNTDAFIIERSHNGQRFDSIGIVKATGLGTNYEFTDSKPFVGIGYYRLKIRDNDGSFSYSPIISVLNGDKTFKIKVYPTLLSEQLTIETDGGNIKTVTVFNLSGQSVLSYESSDILIDRLFLSVDDLVSGVYLVRVQNSAGLQKTFKVVKP